MRAATTVLTILIAAAAMAQDTGLVGEPYIVPAGRSPIPQPGEEIRKPLPFVKLVDDSTPAPPDGAIVPWTDADKYIGHEITIQGTIVRTHNTGGICFLNFVPEHPSDAFYMVVFPPLFEAWGQPPEVFFLDKTVRVTGEIEMHKDKPQLKIRKAEQVEVVE